MQMNLMSSMSSAMPVVTGGQRPMLEAAGAVRQQNAGIAGVEQPQALDDPVYPGECGFAFAALLAALLGQDATAQAVQSRVDAGQETTVEFRQAQSVDGGAAGPADGATVGSKSATVNQAAQSAEHPVKETDTDARVEAAPVPEKNGEAPIEAQAQSGMSGPRRGLNRLAAGEIGSDAARQRNPQLKDMQPVVDPIQTGLATDAASPAQVVGPEQVKAAAAAAAAPIAAQDPGVSESGKAKVQVSQSATTAHEQATGVGLKIAQAESGGVSFARLSAGSQVERAPEREFLQIKQIAAHIQENIGKGMSEMRIQLQPEHLGEMTVKVSFDSNQMNLAMRTETVYAKQMLETNFSQLRDALADHGINVGSFDVGLQDGAGSGPEWEERFSWRRDNETGVQSQQATTVAAQPQLMRGLSSSVVDYFA
jgi:flagellar hook-length control protein FliK